MFLLGNPLLEILSGTSGSVLACMNYGRDPLCSGGMGS